MLDNFCRKKGISAQRTICAPNITAKGLGLVALARHHAKEPEPCLSNQPYDEDEEEALENMYLLMLSVLSRMFFFSCHATWWSLQKQVHICNVIPVLFEQFLTLVFLRYIIIKKKTTAHRCTSTKKSARHAPRTFNI